MCFALSIFNGDRVDDVFNGDRVDDVFNGDRVDDVFGDKVIQTHRLLSQKVNCSYLLFASVDVVHNGYDLTNVLFKELLCFLPRFNHHARLTNFVRSIIQ